MCRCIPLCLIFSVALYGCMKVPQTVHSANIKVDLKIADNTEIYTVRLSGTVRNENNYVAMQDVSGIIDIKDPESKVVLLSLHFEIDIILPMASGMLDIQTEKSAQEVASLLDALDIDRKALAVTGSSESRLLSEDQAVIEKMDFKKKDIVKLLKERI